jgi:hypothetical protein
VTGEILEYRRETESGERACKITAQNRIGVKIVRIIYAKRKRRPVRKRLIRDSAFLMTDSEEKKFRT